MSVIKVKCSDQTLTATEAPLIAAGGTDENYIEFDFDGFWAGFAKVAVFYNKPSKRYKTVIDDNGICVVPPEVTKTRGNMYFGVFGTNSSGVTRTSQMICYYIDEGAVENGAEPSDPTPEMWEQMLAVIQECKENALRVVIGDTKPLDGPAIWFNTAATEGKLLRLGPENEGAEVLAEVDGVSYSVENVSAAGSTGETYNYDII